MTLIHATNISGQFHGEISHIEFEAAAKEQVMLFNSPLYEFNIAQHASDPSSAPERLG